MRLLKNPVLNTKYSKLTREAKNKTKNQTYIDKKSGTEVIVNLMWKKYQEGKKWSGINCTEEARYYSLGSAKSMAKNSRYAGFDDWRITTIKELNSLVYCSNGHRVEYKKDGFDSTGDCSYGNGSYKKPTIDQSLFPATRGDYFLSYSRGWLTSFYTGFDIEASYKRNSLRLVRSIN